MKYLVSSIKKIVFIFILYSLFSILYSFPVHAQSTLGITVSPPRQEISVKPGEKTRIQVKFYNKSDDPVSGLVKKADFLVLDKDGSPTLFDTPSANNRFAASTWLSLSEDRVTIAAHDQYTSTIYINVPADAYPCGRYTSVYFEPATPTLGGQAVKIESNASVAFRIASLIYLNVDGKCRESAYVSKLSTSSFLEYGPIPVDVEIFNRSDYHISPQVGLTLNDLLGKATDTTVLPLVNIFPDTPRQYKAELGSKWMIGRFKVVLNGGYGKTGQTLTAATYIWVFPWRAALLVVLTIVVLYFLIKSVMDKMNKKTGFLEKEIEEEKEEIEKLREALKKRRD